MKIRKKPKRPHRLIAFNAFEDTDQDILDWWEGIEESQRSETTRELIREHLTGRTGRQRLTRKSDLAMGAILLDELARVRDDMTRIHEAPHAMPAYLEQVIQSVASMQPVAVTVDAGPLLSTQIKTEREVNMRKKKW